jgi:hypothetical protein
MTKNQSEAMRAYWASMTPEERSELTKRRVSKPEVRAKMSASRKGQTRTPETKQRMSERKKANWADPEYRATMRQKFSASRKASWADPEFREKTIAAIRAGKRKNKNVSND